MGKKNKVGEKARKGFPALFFFSSLARPLFSRLFFSFSFSLSQSKTENEKARARGA